MTDQPHNNRADNSDDPDLDRRLRRWAEQQHAAAALDAPPPPSIAALAAARRQRHHHHRPLAPVLAAIAITILVALAATALALHTHQTGSTAGCSREFRVDPETKVESQHPTVRVRLTYTGHTPCVISGSPAQLRAVNAQGDTLGPKAAPLHLRPDLTVQPGDEVSFRITFFLQCILVPAGNYTLQIYLRGTANPNPADAISIPLGHLHDDSTTLCQPNYLGSISPPRITR